MEKILKAFAGKKTYIVAACFAFATFAYSVGWLDPHTYQIIQGALLPAGLAALRAGIN